MNMNNTELVLLARAVQWQYQLDQYTDEQLGLILAVYKQVEDELKAKLAKAKITKWSRERSLTLLAEVQDVLLAVRQQLSSSIAAVSSTAGSASHSAHSKILSFDGAAANVTQVAIAAEQLVSVIRDTPVGGQILEDWVNSVFSYNLKDRIKREIAAGLVNGDSYSDLAKRIRAGFPGTERDLATLLRTYVQSANVNAMKSVYEANRDVMDGVVWRATFDSATCLRCAYMDGREFSIDDHPPCPLHPRCRCVLVAKTKGLESLGLSAEAAEEAARPYVIRKGAVNLRSGGKIIDVGTFKGSFAQWLKTTPEWTQKQLLGTKRLEALKDGRIKFDDLAEVATGRIKTLAELGLS